MSIVPAPFRALWSGVIRDLLTAEEARRNHHEVLREIQLRLRQLVIDVGNIGTSGGGGAVTDGTYGDIVVSAVGTIWTIVNNAVTTSKIANGAVTYAKLAFGVFTSVADGLVPASGGSALDVLHGDGSWSPDAKSTPGWFGTGIDGDVTITGGTTTMGRDMFYNNLTVEATGVLDTGGYQICVANNLVVETGGRIIRNGNNAAGSVAGATRAGVTTGSGGAGGAGGSTIGNASGAVTGQPQPLPLTGATSGKGGNGGLGPSGAGGTAGNVGQAANSVGGVWHMPYLGTMNYSEAISSHWPGGGGGAGGGGGGGGAAGVGGGGGGGAGCVTCRARHVTLDGTIEAVGGNGANGSGTNAGGGGSGGGGKIVLPYETYAGSGSLLVTAGTPGNPTGTGVIGATGSTGYAIAVQV